MKLKLIVLEERNVRNIFYRFIPSDIMEDVLIEKR